MTDEASNNWEQRTIIYKSCGAPDWVEPSTCETFHSRITTTVRIPTSYAETLKTYKTTIATVAFRFKVYDRDHLELARKSILSPSIIWQVREDSGSMLWKQPIRFVAQNGI